MRKINYKITNVCALADLGPHISLEKTSRLLRPSIYDPEQFPALIFKVRGTRVSVLIFSSGKAVLTGARSENEVVNVLRFISEALEEKGEGHE